MQHASCEASEVVRKQSNKTNAVGGQARKELACLFVCVCFDTCLAHGTGVDTMDNRSACLPASPLYPSLPVLVAEKVEASFA